MILLRVFCVSPSALRPQSIVTTKVIPIQSNVRPPRVAPLRYDGLAPADTLGRGLRDLRISVTDRCNFRCTYCMPREVFDEQYRFLPQADLLRFEEITRLARIFVGLGIKKIRLTGGEPLVRRNLDDLIRQLATLNVDLTLTTNGSLLAEKAVSLKAAGLHRLTVSLDSLDEATFRAMNDADVGVAQVLEGIAAATAAGFSPIKINMVVKRGVNDAHLVEMARHFRGTGHIVRFIEFMDVGTTNGWRLDDVIPSAEVLRRIGAVFPLEPVSPEYRGEVAERWRYRDGGGEIGVISSVTQAFCRDCNRLRLSTEGALFTCLFGSSGYDLRALLREGADDATLRDHIAALWRARADRYSELRMAQTALPESARLRRVEMSYIGG